MSDANDIVKTGLGKVGINLEEVHCPQCGERMPPLRIPEGLHQLLWGGWICPKCSCRMDKWGKAVDPAS